MEIRSNSSSSHKEDREDPKNYRRITILSSRHKIYASIIADKIQREVEENDIIPTIKQDSGKEEVLRIKYILKHVIEKDVINV